MVRARIVIVNYNGNGFVDAAIASALAQDREPDVVLVDNASTDGSPEAVAQAFPSVRLIRNERNAGFAAAANAGALAEPIDYEYVAFLNPDATARAGWIARTTDWMQSNHTDVASTIVTGNAGPFFAGGRWKPFLGTALLMPAFSGERTEWVSGCAMVVRREVFAGLGGFDRSYFLYYEDVDLSLRARRAGLKLGVSPEALVDHPHEGRSADQLGSVRKRRLGLHSKGRLVRRFAPIYAWPTALAFQCLISPALNGAALREYPLLVGSFVKGFLQVEEHVADIA